VREAASRPKETVGNDVCVRYVCRRAETTSLVAVMEAVEVLLAFASHDSGQDDAQLLWTATSGVH
jgi:hypothetical protein